MALLLLAGSADADPGDPFLEGYASAILERDLGLRAAQVEARDGRLRVVIESLGEVPEDRIVAALSQIEGVREVEIHTAAGRAVIPAASSDEAKARESGLEVLPRKEIFDPLLADPRQPHFSASYLWYIDDPEVTHVGSANLGETFALLGGPLGRGRWELGLLAGVFSIFDLDRPSYDLLNSDFLVGATLSARGGRLSGQLRLYHQSSHLGDELLLQDDPPERLNVSFEAVEAIASVDLHSAVRLYGGGGVIVNDEPNFEPWSAQGGLEIESPWALGGVARPIAAGDLQLREGNDWREEIAARVGVQIENPALSKLRFQILFEYFKGNSPNGQFFERRIEVFGVGAHLHF